MKLSTILNEVDQSTVDRQTQAHKEAHAIHGGKTDSVSNGKFTLGRKKNKDGDRFVMTGAPHGEHSLHADPSTTSLDRLYVHWLGYQNIPQSK